MENSQFDSEQWAYQNGLINKASIERFVFVLVIVLSVDYLFLLLNNSKIFATLWSDLSGT